MSTQATLHGHIQSVVLHAKCKSTEDPAALVKVFSDRIAELTNDGKDTNIISVSQGVEMSKLSIHKALDDMKQLDTATLLTRIASLGSDSFGLPQSGAAAPATEEYILMTLRGWLLKTWEQSQGRSDTWEENLFIKKPRGEPLSIGSNPLEEEPAAMD